MDINTNEANQNGGEEVNSKEAGEKVVAVKNNKPVAVAFIIFGIIALGIAIFFYLDYRVRLVEKDQEQIISGYLEAYEGGYLDEAIKKGEIFIKKYPSDLEGYLQLANSYLQKGSLEFNEEENANIAIELLEKAKSLNETNSGVYRLLGYAYEIKEDYENSFLNYDKAIELNPGDSDTWNARGHAYELFGDLVTAENDYVEAIELDRTNVLAYINLANIYIKTNRSVENDAEGLIDYALENADDERIIAEAFQLAGVLYFERGDYEEAALLFDDSLEYDDRLVNSWMGLAYSDFMLLGTEGESEYEYGEELSFILEYIEEALDINENQTSAYVLQGIISEGTGDVETAKEMYTTALNVISDDITLGALEKSEVTKEVLELLANLSGGGSDLSELKKVFESTPEINNENE